MKLGIHVKTDRHLDHVIGMTKAAVAKGHEVAIFTMSEGERLLEKPAFMDLCTLAGVTMSYCDHNATHMGIDKSAIPADVVCGSQLNNANMVHNADRVIVL